MPNSTSIQPLISVIIPCYDCRQYVEKTLASVLAQTYRKLEIIVVDDGSTDDSAEIIRRVASKDQRIRSIEQPNSGVSSARNNGLEAATGEFVAFLDADDYWHPAFLEKLQQALAGSEAHLAYCGWQNVNLPGAKGDPFIPPDYSKVDRVKLLLGGNRWPIHAVLAYRSTILRTGGFDRRLSHAEDYLLWIKVATAYPIVEVPEVMAFYVHHGGPQASKQRATTAIQHLKAQRLFIREFPERVTHIGRKELRLFLYGYLLNRGYDCYWDRDLRNARTIFLEVMKNGYGTINDWKYMLPSLMPYRLHEVLIGLCDGDTEQR